MSRRKKKLVPPGPATPPVTLADAEQARLREIEAGILNLKGVLADRWLAVREAEAAVAQALEALAAEGRQIAAAHGIDLSGPQRWHLDTRAMTLARVG